MPARPDAVVTAQPAPPLTWTRTFLATASQVSQARRFLTSHTGHLPLAGDAALCVSELATNAIQHSHSAQPGGHFTVSIVLTPAVLLAEVSDQGGPWAPGPSADDQRGRGLHIVGQLATCWGATATPTGRTVWFTIPAHP
jgi:anti-sigma regulatory factor (Ser/Thr protein kinase)